MRGSWTFAITLATVVVAVATAENHHGNSSIVVPHECPKIDPIDTDIMLAHEWDCHRFYRCVKGDRWLQTCANVNGTEMHFNPSFQKCDSPERVNCNTTGAFTTAFPGNCSMYSVTIGNKTINMSCPRDLYYDPETRDCLRALYAHCDQPIFVANENSCYDYKKIVNGTLTTEKCPTGLGFNRVSKTCVPLPAAECPSLMESCKGTVDRTKLADRNNNSNYYYWNNDTTIFRTCPNDLHFHRCLGICVDPVIAGRRYEYVAPHNFECGKYWMFTNNGKFMMKCNDGMEFSPALRKCVPKSESGCQPRQTKCRGTTDCRSVTEPKPVNGTDSCAEYEELVNNTLITRSCPQGQHMSLASGNCVPSSESKCKSSLGPCEGVTDGELFANSTNCGNYLSCTGGKLISQNCPSGYHFHKTLKNCVGAEVAGCNYTFTVPDYWNCTRYYRIENNVKSVVTCPKGLYYSSKNMSCVTAEESGCQKRFETIVVLDVGESLIKRRNSTEGSNVHDIQSIIGKIQKKILPPGVMWCPVGNEDWRPWGVPDSARRERLVSPEVDYPIIS